MSDQHIHIYADPAATDKGTPAGGKQGKNYDLGIYLMGFWPLNPHPHPTGNSLALEGWFRPKTLTDLDLEIRDEHGAQMNVNHSINVDTPHGRFTITFPGGTFPPGRYFIVVYEDSEHTTELGGCAFQTQ